MPPSYALSSSPILSEGSPSVKRLFASRASKIRRSRRAAGERNMFWKKSAEPAGEFKDRKPISNKAMVYLVIIVLIVILCIVYVMQLRDARRGGQAQEAPAAEAPAEGTAEAPAEKAAEAPAEKAAETPAEGAAQ